MSIVLWENGPHEVVKNNDGTISAWINCGQADWEQSPQAALDATGRVQQVNSNLVDRVPQGERPAGVIEVVFRNYGEHLSNEQLDTKVYEHGETMVSLVLQAKVNEIFPELAGNHINGTSWDDAGWCHATFYNNEVFVYRDDDAAGWNATVWFPSIRKD